ncbi:GtrA family protein [Candidatus Uhrbacteria bacterium]|nr:GtrA family protein [Candidatus Uhrbacteria bacterium]
MVRRLIGFVKREQRMLARYLFVGGSSFVVKVGAYALLSRILWTGGSRTAENVIALVVAATYNYFLHRFWTFRHQGPAPGSAARYLGVLLAGNGLDALLFYVGHEILGIYDFLVQTFATGFITLFSFLIHHLFTFHSDPWKKREGVRAK